MRRNEPTLNDIIAKTLDPKRKNVEPVQRLRRGEGVGFVAHRFPIKGGVSYADVLRENVTKDNALFRLLSDPKR
jgi:hypothetical protein